MASRRVLLLVGPCRVDGGDGASTGDLGSLGDVDKARQTRRSYFTRENGHPRPDLTLPARPPIPSNHRRRSTRSTHPRDWWRRSIARVRRAYRPAATRDGATSASARHRRSSRAAAGGPTSAPSRTQTGHDPTSDGSRVRVSAMRSRRWPRRHPNAHAIPTTTMTSSRRPPTQRLHREPCV